MEKNTRVRVVKAVAFGGSKFIGREGVITSINQNSALPYHVTLDGDKFETDFVAEELEALQGRMIIRSFTVWRREVIEGTHYYNRTTLVEERRSLNSQISDLKESIAKLKQTLKSKKPVKADVSKDAYDRWVAMNQERANERGLVLTIDDKRGR